MMVASSAQGATQNSQQGKMVTCNQQASGKTGDERARFMKHCLASGKSTHQQVSERFGFGLRFKAGTKD